MKKILISILLCISQISFSNEHNNQLDEDFLLLQEAIEIVASMSDNIANLVIQQHSESNTTPEIKKQECIALVQKITAFVVTILKKQKLKKASRKIFLYSADSINKEFNYIAEDILNKINMG